MPKLVVLAACCRKELVHCMSSFMGEWEKAEETLSDRHSLAARDVRRGTGGNRVLLRAIRRKARRRMCLYDSSTALLDNVAEKDRGPLLNWFLNERRLPASY
jgi:hypothetical protein